MFCLAQVKDRVGITKHQHTPLLSL